MFQQTHASSTRGTHGVAPTVGSLSASQSSLCSGVSPDSRQTVPSRMWIQIGLQTWKADAARRDDQAGQSLRSTYVYDADVHWTVQRGQ